MAQYQRAQRHQRGKGKGQGGGLRSAVEAQGPLMGCPRLAGGHECALRSKTRPAEATTVSSLSILWWLRPSARCHGNLAGLTICWTQSWHLQVELVGPSSQLSSLGEVSLISRWSQNHHHLFTPVTILGLASPEKKNSPQGRRITQCPQRHNSPTLMVAFEICLTGRKRMDVCSRPSYCKAGPQGSDTALGPSLRTRASGSSTESPARRRGFKTWPLTVHCILSCFCSLYFCFSLCKTGTTLLPTRQYI